MVTDSVTSVLIRGYNQTTLHVQGIKQVQCAYFMSVTTCLLHVRYDVPTLYRGYFENFKKNYDAPALCRG